MKLHWHVECTRGDGWPCKTPGAASVTLTGATIRGPTVRKAHPQRGPAPSSPELHAEH